MASLSDVVDIPAHLNAGLTACTAAVLAQKFGSPGKLTKQCSSYTGPKRNLIRTMSVGPFRATGMIFALNSLATVFAEVQQSHPDVFDAVKTAGMLCVRGNKANPQAFSNHSWGCAIDLYFGAEVVPFGTNKTQLGFLYIDEVFRREKWYWGAGFSGRKDAMHFELSREFIDQVQVDGSSGPDLLAAADYIADTGYDKVEEVA